MVLTNVQKHEILQVIETLISYSTGRRVLSQMFRTLPDPIAWKAYYDVIPQPRSLDGVKAAVEKDKVKSVKDALSDLELIFANALHFNEEGSIIALDAKSLQGILAQAWSSKPSLQSSGVSLSSGSRGQPVASTSSSRPLGSSNQTAHHDPVAPSTSFAPSSHLEAGMADAASQDEEVDPSIDLLVKRAEDKMKIWEGPGLEGWMPLPKGEPHARYVEIVSLLKNYRVAASGDRPADALEKLQEPTHIKYLYHSDPISFALIESRAQGKFYSSAQAFDMDLYRLFEKGRRTYQDVSREDYGRVLLLQRMWQHLTSPTATQIPAMSRASANFCSISAGPGTAKPARSVESDEGVTTFRIPSKDRDFTDKAIHKGCTYQIGDYVHLMNPDDASKPIVGQIFRTYIPHGKPGQQAVSACWYYLPEQTVHSRTRLFYEKEVLKTGQFADHVIEDIIEKIGCQFYTKHIRGRPLPPLWYPGWPLYVCDQRYNDRDRVFVRIKNWASCIPEEIRNANFMPIRPFDETAQNRTVLPRKVKSPFLKGVKGPGMIGEEGKVDKARSATRDDSAAGNVTAGASTSATAVKPKRAATKRALAATDARATEGSTHSTPDPMSQPFHSLPTVVQLPQHHQHKRKIDDRTVITAAGGMTYLTGAKIDQLPRETVEKFDTDPKTNRLLWFSGAPIHPPPLSAYRPRYSLEYLSFLARKRKAENDEPEPRGSKHSRTEDAEESMEVEERDETAEAKSDHLQTKTELLLNGKQADLGQDSVGVLEETIGSIGEGISEEILVRSMENFTRSIVGVSHV